MPASAQSSSLFGRSPLMPTAPTTSPCALRLSTLGQRTTTQPHAQYAPGLADCDLGAQDAGAVLAQKRYQMTACIEHSYRERFELEAAASSQCDVGDPRCGRKVEAAR
jgi:hypothetical protein